MTTSRFPLWRTRPAGFAVSGYWPILTGSLAVLVFAPLLGGLMSLLGSALTTAGTPASTLFDSITIVLVASPLFSWAALIVAIPVSGLAAREGFAGWGVAALGGGVAATIMGLFLNGGFRMDLETLYLAVFGAVLALIYWGAIRLVHPTALGIDFNASA